MIIYDEAIKVMKKEEIDNHYSDLYLLKNAESDKLINNYEYKKHVTIFKSNIDGRKWYDIPFAYSPYFEEKMKEHNLKSL